MPVIQRAEMLAELMRFRHGIAVAGTHGKTTTTSMVASILGEAKLDPTFVIGGRLTSAGTNARLGQSRYLVAEADESDASFLHLQPMVAVVTNIDADHMHTYGGDFARLENTFIEFLQNLPFYGLAVLCLDDKNIREILPQVKKRYITYGLSSQADIRATHVRHDGFTTSFIAHYKGYRLGEVSFRMPGAHNVLNAMACIAVAMELDVPFEAIREGFARFGGVGRRFTVKGEPKGIMVVDDYGHHPAEIKATLAAARQGWPERRIIAAFQPHRYTRTFELFDEFVTAFYDADVLVLTDVYAAGEQPIEGATAERLAAEIRRHGQKDVTWVGDREKIPTHLAGMVREGDIVIPLGARNIWQQGEALVKLLEG